MERVCGGGNQRDSEMNERPLKRRKRRGGEAHRQIAKVELSRGSRVYGCSRLNCSKYGALNASDVTVPYKTVRKPLVLYQSGSRLQSSPLRTREEEVERGG